ncbi:DUF4304 domain-containing protein [Shewanella mangrovisoli]|nr:DUF4304 domain-containing protein [Shewanella mangrovisoli]QYK07552.1 DUF4304 domain-containing protein [Shewanella mangrovisoli]
MKEELKLAVTDYLRGQGFKGSIPIFSRETKGLYQTLDFQFNKYGGSFAVNLSLLEPNNQFLKLPMSKQKILASRRLGSLSRHLKNKQNQDYWFRFVKGSFFPTYNYKKAAQEFIAIYSCEAEKTFEYMLGEMST